MPVMSARTPNLSGENALGALSARYVDIDALPWAKGNFEGITWKVLLEDKERGLTTAISRWAPGASLPLHEHLDIEQTYVLEGSLCDEEGECKAGQYVWRPSGSRHRAWSPNGCVLLAIFMQPNVFIDDKSLKSMTEGVS
jgi:anti-sigma factor ChrR (cupin superfamily)